MWPFLGEALLISSGSCAAPNESTGILLCYLEVWGAYNWAKGYISPIFEK